MVDRIGGPERLRAILTRFYTRLVDDPIVGFFFAGKNLQQVIEGQWGFLMRAFVAAERFHGKNPLVAHTELAPIKRGHFDRRIFVLREVLESEGLVDEDVAAWLKVEESFRRRIVQS